MSNLINLQKATTQTSSFQYKRIWHRQDIQKRINKGQLVPVLVSYFTLDANKNI